MKTRPLIQRRRQGWPWLLLLLCPMAAQAHSSVKSLGEFPNGLLHPLVTPSHVLLLIGLGLLVGQQSPQGLQTPMKVFLGASGTALLLTMTGGMTAVAPLLLILLAMTSGVAVALDKPWPALGRNALLVVAGAALGVDSAVESGAASSVLQTLLGTWCALALVVFDVAYYVGRCREKPWQKIGARVIGSWIIAISLLMLAFSLRK